MTVKRHAGKVTYAKANRVITAIILLIECSDFRELDTDGTALRDLDRAADHARRMRDQAGPQR